MVRYSWFFLFLFAAGNLHAQSGMADSALTNSGLDYAKHFYFTQRGEESAIYNGRQQEEYPPSIQGNAFFQSLDWQKGWVMYNNVLYENIIMKYDLLTDQLVVTPSDSAEIFIALFSPRVTGFSFAGLHFVRMDKMEENTMLSPGFYRQLVQGKLTALEKRTKIIHGEIIGTTFIQKFVEEVRYYVCRNGVCTAIKNKKSMLRFMKERRKELQQFLSKNKLNYRKNPEKTITAAAEFYNKSGY